jgi:rhodanese-related sulfurtransferase
MSGTANVPITPQQATWDDVVAEAEAGGYRIITTEALAEKYGKDPSALMLIDTRQEWEYRTGHIAGALLFPMEPTWWARWRKAGELGNCWVKTRSARLCSTERAWHESAATRRPVWPLSWVTEMSIATRSVFPMAANGAAGSHFSPAGLTTPLQSAAAPGDTASLQGWAMLWTLLGVFAGGWP